MANEQLIKELSDNITSIVENNTKFDVAIALLQSTPDLSALLVEYRGVDPVFSSLITPSSAVKNTALFTYLIGVNADILHMPLMKGGLPNVTLLQLFLDESEIYRDILAWLTVHKSELMAAEEMRSREIDQWLESALMYHKKDPVKFQELFADKSLKHIHQLLAASNNKLLSNLRRPPLDALDFVIQLDFSILHVSYSDADLFTYLCEDPMFYLPTLTRINELYHSQFSRDERDMLAGAFEGERLRVIRQSKQFERKPIIANAGSRDTIPSDTPNTPAQAASVVAAVLDNGLFAGVKQSEATATNAKFIPKPPSQQSVDQVEKPKKEYVRSPLGLAVATANRDENESFDDASGTIPSARK